MLWGRICGGRSPVVSLATSSEPRELDGPIILLGVERKCREGSFVRAWCSVGRPPESHEPKGTLQGHECNLVRPFSTEHDVDTNDVRCLLEEFRQFVFKPLGCESTRRPGDADCTEEFVAVYYRCTE